MPSTVNKVLPEELLEKQDFPRTVIISVSVIGVILLFINIGLVAGCMLKRRTKRIRGWFLLFLILRLLEYTYLFIYFYFKRNERMKNIIMMMILFRYCQSKIIH